jgi:hypothetical protein
MRIRFRRGSRGSAEEYLQCVPITFRANARRTVCGDDTDMSVAKHFAVRRRLNCDFAGKGKKRVAIEVTSITECANQR